MWVGRLGERAQKNGCGGFLNLLMSFWAKEFAAVGRVVLLSARGNFSENWRPRVLLYLGALYFSQPIVMGARTGTWKLKHERVPHPRSCKAFFPAFRRA